MHKKSLKYSLSAALLSVGLVACQSAEADLQSVEATERVESIDVVAEVTEPVAIETPSTEDVVAKLQAKMAEAASTTGPGSPALWTLKDEDTTIHLFGTVHLLRPETQWRTSEMEAAFESAETLVLEVDTTSPEAQQAMGGLIQKYAQFSDGQTLNGVLEDSDEPIVEAALASFNIPLEAVQPLKPWMVSLQMSVLQMQQAGYQPNAGVETILTAEATEAGKQLAYLETPEEQISILAGGELEDQIDGLIFASKTLDFGPQMLDALVSEWADGDVAGLGAIIADPDALGGEDAYEALLVQRNKNWVPQIKAMLEEPGTVFVAVGSGHLAGPDSVITMLRSDGLEVSGPQ